MMSVRPKKTRRPMWVLSILAAVLIASFGVDVRIENADACSFPAYSIQCFAPAEPEKVSDAPAKPELITVLAEHESYEDGGCGASGSSCTGTTYSTIKFTVSDQQYDDIDSLSTLGLIIRTESDTEASREFIGKLTQEEYGGCNNGDVVTGYNLKQSYDDALNISTQELTFTTSNLTLSRYRGLRVSIAFVDHHGNIGPFSEFVELRGRSRVIDQDR